MERLQNIFIVKVFSITSQISLENFSTCYRHWNAFLVRNIWLILLLINFFAIVNFKLSTKKILKDQPWTQIFLVLLDVCGQKYFFLAASCKSLLEGCALIIFSPIPWVLLLRVLPFQQLQLWPWFCDPHSKFQNCIVVKVLFRETCWTNDKKLLKMFLI